MKIFDCDEFTRNWYKLKKGVIMQPQEVSAFIHYHPSRVVTVCALQIIVRSFSRLYHR
jgi:hypothetical protein